MRSWAIALLLIPLLLPAAAAQQSYVQIEIVPFIGNIMPLGPPAVLPMNVTTDCPASAAASGIDVRYSLARIPSWASAVITPANDHIDFSQCIGNQARFHATISVSVDDRAPAFMPETLEVRADMLGGPAPGGASGRNSVPIMAGYYSVLDVQAALTQKPAAPREIVTFPVRFANLGNGASKVNFDLVQVDEGAFPALPPPLVLSPRTGGAADEGTVLNVQAYRVPGVAGPQSFTLRYQAVYALDPMLHGAAGNLTFSLIPRAGASDNDTAPAPPSGLDKLAPGPSLPLALVPLGLAALARRRFA